jgi:hypothetical protein
MENGTYAGYHPGESGEAIAHLEALRERGAEYILFPETARWWLEFYSDFIDVLNGGAEETASRVSTCVIFDLRNKIAGNQIAEHLTSGPAIQAQRIR